MSLPVEICILREAGNYPRGLPWHFTSRLERGKLGDEIWHLNDHLIDGHYYRRLLLDLSHQGLLKSVRGKSLSRDRATITTYQLTGKGKAMLKAYGL